MLAPTRELAVQISRQFRRLVAGLGLKVMLTLEVGADLNKAGACPPPRTLDPDTGVCHGVLPQKHSTENGRIPGCSFILSVVDGESESWRAIART